VASFRAIAAVSRAVLRLLEDSCPRAEFPDAQFVLQQATDIAKAPIHEGVSLYLYRIGVNTTRRNLPPRIEPDGRQFRPAIPLDLYYALCIWGRSVDIQQRLLGFCIRSLEDTPTFPAGVLNQPGPEPATFHDHETVQMVCDSLSLQDLQLLWDALKPNVPLTVGYVARIVPIDSEIPIIEGPAVQTRVFEMRGAPA
jgi:Pvc16 N-terminal domain